MVGRTRSNKSTASSASNAPAEEVVTAILTEEQIDIDLSDTPFLPIEKEMALAMPPTAPAAEYVEDILDFSDDELIPTNLTVNAPSAEDEAAALASSHLEEAKRVMAWSAETMLTQSTNMASALQLHNVGDTVSVQVSAHGVTYDVYWKVAAVTSASSTNPGPLATLSATTEPTTRNSIKCKFGKHCNKGSACPFDHTVKPKLCTWINTPMGCMKGVECEFSHEFEGVKCTRSEARYTCANGSRCAYKHGDDGGVEVTEDAPEEKQNDGTKQNDGGKEEGEEKKDAAQQVAGKKRGHEDGGEDVTPKKQRLGHENAERGGKQHRGRGRGRGNGRGRGRGRGGGGGQGIRVRGAATKGAE
jgi:hypothetical protein